MKTMEDLRETLFVALDKIMDNSIQADQAKVVVEMANCIIDSARAEIELVKAIGSIKGSGFIKLPSNNN